MVRQGVAQGSGFRRALRGLEVSDGLDRFPEFAVCVGEAGVGFLRREGREGGAKGGFCESETFVLLDPALTLPVNEGSGERGEETDLFAL